MSGTGMQLWRTSRIRAAVRRGGAAWLGAAASNPGWTQREGRVDWGQVVHGYLEAGVGQPILIQSKRKA